MQYQVITMVTNKGLPMIKPEGFTLKEVELIIIYGTLKTKVICIEKLV